MKKVLVTGGAGYIGSVLVRILLKKGYYVRIYDNLRFGGESLLGVINEDKLEFVKGDITDKKGLKKAIKNMNYIVHLAAIVGDPACAKEPKHAENVNLNSSKYLFNIAMGNEIERFVFSSTCSNYGKMKNPDKLINENSELSPISLYAETKVAFEKFMFNEVDRSEYFSPTCLRFSTVYGLSPRMRFDLTVNEFTKELIMGRQLAILETILSCPRLSKIRFNRFRVSHRKSSI